MNSNISNFPVDDGIPLRKTRSPWRRRFFLDCEFSGFDTQQLISIAIVSEDDSYTFYGEITDYDAELSDFVRQTVLPQLGLFPGRAMTRAQLRAELFAWLSCIPAKPRPILSFDYGGDYELLLALTGQPLPQGWRSENVRQRIDPARRAEYFRIHGGEHHALHDARANSMAFS